MSDYDSFLDSELEKYYEDDELTEEELEELDQIDLDIYLENKQNEEDWADEFYSPDYPEGDV